MCLLRARDDFVMRFLLGRSHSIFSTLGTDGQIGELCGKWFDHDNLLLRRVPLPQKS